ISNVNNDSYKMTLKGLDRLRCLDFRQGNIILDVVIVSGESPDKNALRYLLDLEDDETPDFLLDRIEKIEQGILTFVNITPSYGCEVLALCSELCLEKIKDSIITTPAESIHPRQIRRSNEPFPRGERVN